MPFGFDCIDNEITRFIRTAEDYIQLSTLFIYNPTRDILLLTPQIVIICLIVASSYSTA